MAEKYHQNEEEYKVEEIEKETINVELQLTKLTNKINELEKKIATEEFEKQKLQKQLNFFCHDLESARWEKEPIKKLLNVTPKHSKFQKWIEPENPIAISTIKCNEELKNRLEEERAKNLELSIQYENHLSAIRKKYKRNIVKIKQVVLEQVEYLVRKYRDLANEAIVIAKKEREKVIVERQKCRKLAEMACKNFENDLKERTKKVLIEYRNIAQMAHESAQKERNELREKCNTIGKVVDEERQKFEATVFKEAEKRVIAYRNGFTQFKRQIDNERKLFEQMIQEISHQVEEECKNYEAFLMKSMEQILTENGIEMNQEKLKDYLQKKKNRIESLNSQNYEKIVQDKSFPEPSIPKKNEDRQMAPKLSNASVKVRYGFQALSSFSIN